MSWTQLRLITPLQYTDACSQLLLDVGCAGVQIDDSAVLFDESEDATIVTRDEAAVTGYLNCDDDLERIRVRLLQWLQHGGIEARLELETLDEQAWSTQWRENFPPLYIGPFTILPPWEESQAIEENHLIIRIDPGLAFGTGQHPTTRMCLELLGEHLAAREDSVVENSARMLDVGCGSGILSIAGALLGASVTASDLDAFCVYATRDNAAANGASVNVVQAAGLGWVATPFPLVIANLMSDLLIRLSEDMARVTQADGTLIVSGISAPRAEEVETVFHNAGFTTLERRDLDGEQRGDFTERWTAFVMKKVK